MRPGDLLRGSRAAIDEKVALILPLVGNAVDPVLGRFNVVLRASIEEPQKRTRGDSR